MSTLHDAHAWLADKARAVQIKVQRALGQVAQYIQLGQGGGGILQRCQLADQVFQQVLIEHLFPSQGTALGRQCLVFELFQLWGDKPLCTFERLATLIVDGRRLGLLARQFDEIAVHAVVADFQVGQSGTGFFAGFQVNQELPGVFAQGLQLVQLAVVTGLQNAAVTDDCRRVVDDGFFQQRRQFRVSTGGDRELLQVRRVQFGHRRLQLWQGTEGITQARQVTRPRITQADPRQDALDIADFLELWLQLFKAIAVQQAGNRGLTRLQHAQVAQRTV